MIVDWVKNAQYNLSVGNLDKVKSILNDVSSENPYKHLLQAEIHLLSGEFQEVRTILNDLSQSISSSENKFQFWKSLIQNKLCTRIGDFDQALVSIKDAEKYLNAMSSEQRDDFGFNIIGFYRTKGNFLLLTSQLLKSIENYHRALNLAVKMDLEGTIAGLHHNIGMIYSILNQYSVADEYYSNALHKWKAMDAETSLLFALQKMVINQIELDQREEAKSYLDELEELIHDDLSSFGKVLYNLAKGVYLKSSSRAREKFKSQEYFMKVVNDENAEHNSVMQALLYLADTLVDELRAFPNKEVIWEINALSTEIVERAHEFKSLHIIFQILLVQADFALIRGKLNAAKDFLDEARHLVDNTDLSHLKRQVDEKEESMLEEVQRWHNALENVKPLVNDLEMLKLTDYLHDIDRLLNK